MQFLKTLCWVLAAVVVALFASRNWVPVTLSLWGDIQADIKIPALLLALFLLGFLPTWLIMRAKVWRLERRIEAVERNRGPAMDEELVVEEEDALVSEQ